MQILVTGGAGFIGANLVRKLQSRDHEVIVFDNLSRGRPEYLPAGVELIVGDIRDRDATIAAMKGMDGVIHLAAYGSVVESVADPWTNFEINVRGTLSVLDSAKQCGIQRLIFASTGGALIGNVEPPVDENSLPKPISPYGTGKLCGEAYCHAYAKAYGLSTVALRFANVYGPFSAHKKGAVTKFIKCLMRDEPIPIFGDGSASRDYLHVDDLCEGIALAVVAEIQPGEVVHLASGTETTVLELANTLIQLYGKRNHPIEHKPRRIGEVDRNFALYDKAARIFGFKPKYKLNEGLLSTVHWYLDREKQVLAMAESDS